jgi:hypothetical protein
MRYRSAKSTGFTVLVASVILLLIVSIAITPGDLRLIITLGAGFGIGLLLWIWFGTWYEFQPSVLLLRCGPFYERIPYDRIAEASRIKGMASSMALSSDMIELRHGENYLTGTTMISPKDKEAFLAELKARCPTLKPVTGD